MEFLLKIIWVGILIRIASYCSNKAKEINQNPFLWGFLGGLLPPITPLVLYFWAKKNEKEYSEIELEIKQREAYIQSMVAKALRKEGFIPEFQDEGISFKYEGKEYLLLFTPDDIKQFRMEHFLLRMEENERLEVLRLTNKLNSQFKYSKIVIYDNIALCRTVMQLNQASDIEDTFWNAFQLTSSACDAFWREVNLKKGFSMN